MRAPIPDSVTAIALSPPVRHGPRSTIFQPSSAASGLARIGAFLDAVARRDEHAASASRAWWAPLPHAGAARRAPVRSRPAARGHAAARPGSSACARARRAGLRFRPRCGSRPRGSRPPACPASRSRSTWRTRGCGASSSTMMVEVEGGTRARVPAPDAPRDGPRARHTPTGCTGGRAGARVFGAPRRVVPATTYVPRPGEPRLRDPPRQLVRAEPSARGLRRDVRGVAGAALGLAAPLPRAGRRCASSSTWTS